ncbi:MAG: 3-dehydroquinate synthase [Bacteroidota bacterium]
MTPTVVTSPPIDIVTDQDSYRIVFDRLAGVPDRMADLGMKPGRCLIVTDETVGALHGEVLSAALTRSRWDAQWIVVPAGEASKSYEHLQRIYDEGLARGIDRQTPVIAMGGGVVGDLAGFAAATLLRGLPLIQVPTTLIAQVDSSIGGKTGINHRIGKNLIGAFHQPVLVATDTALLASLPDREWYSGLAEVVKHALIADAGFARWLGGRWQLVLDRDEATVAKVVRRAAMIKAAIVQQDIHEHGRRAWLNFGHTFGHAIERTAGYGSISHGEAVAIGMRAAVYLSERLHPSTDFSAAHDLVSRIPIETRISELSTIRLTHAMQFDKKVVGGSLRLVCLARIGEAEVRSDIDPSWIDEAWSFAKSP